MNVQSPELGAGASPAANRAGGSSFYLAMRILGREKRAAMFEIYSFCREVDDIADEDRPRATPPRAPFEWRKNIDALYSGSIPSGLKNLANAISRFGLRKDDFLAVIDGVEMDARADIRAPSLNELDLYCDRVACAVGRLSVRVFGMDDSRRESSGPPSWSRASAYKYLARYRRGCRRRALYLPKEALALAGIENSDPKTVTADPRLGTACAFIVERARGHFTKADEIMSRFHAGLFAPRKSWARSIARCSKTWYRAAGRYHGTVSA